MEDHEETSLKNTAVEDLKLLIESVKYQQEDFKFQEQALKTMASIFRTSDSASSYLVNSSGLEYIYKMLISSGEKTSSLREACLHALGAACEDNAIAQQALCTQEVFCVLKKFLLMKSSTRLQTLSCYLLICLMTNNETGQTLARKTKCIETLRYLFKNARSPSCSPRIPNQLTECLSSECKENESLIILWQTATNALSACVNNPQNSENQIFCSSAFPAAVYYLRNCNSASVQTTALAFLRNALANNSRSQVSFRLVGGLRTLCDVFTEELHAARQIPSSVLKSLVLTIEAAVYGNDMCRDSIAELEIVPLLLQSLQLCFASPKFKIQCLITLAACIEGCESSCKQFFSNEGMFIVVKLLAESQNCEELQKSATCVLHTCLEQAKTSNPGFMDKLSSSDLLSDNLEVLQEERLQGNKRSSIQAERTLPEITAEKYSDSSDIIETKSNVSMEQSDLVDKIEDLTNEVCCLKQLFTTKEEHFETSVTNNLLKCFMDMMSKKSDSGGIENGAGDTYPRGESSRCMREDSDVVTTNTAESESVNSGRTSETENEGRVITEQTKDDIEIARENTADRENYCVVQETGNEGNTPSKTKTSSGRTHHEDKSLSKEKAIENCNDIHVVGGGFKTNTKNINNPSDTNIVRDNDSISGGPGSQIPLKNFANSRQDIQLGISTVRSDGISSDREDQDCEDHQKGHDDVLKSVHNNMTNGNHEQEKYQERHVPDVFDFVPSDHASEKEAVNSGALVEDITRISGMISNQRSPIREFPKNCPSLSYNHNRETANIRYGKTPTNQKTIPRNRRSSKRQQLTTPKEGMDGCKNPKRSRRRLISDSDDECGNNECLDEDIVATNVSVENAVKLKTVKAPIPPVQEKLRQQLTFEHNQKINPKCLGCRCDFSNVNSHSFLSSVRRSLNTCSKHRVFVTNIVTALRRYQLALKTKRRSPDFDFHESPKRNARRKDSPAKIMKVITVKPKGKSSNKIPFSANEIEILKEGVDKYGLKFNLIERYCNFDTKRSAKTLKQKYQGIIMAKGKKQQKRRPFTAQEEDNLKEGVLKYGYKWKSILDHYRFNQGRTPQNLKDKWRNLLKTC